ncbi:putative adipose-regulatory protein-domain-containing protein [Aspergillus pseudonomiae]|uniref:Putative adipose-regulatory protein-domain-containing protein n=1 Tax=Aspergillus pseudonomiae TaxID=1506151 RepID=A0A5N7CXH1_9EURO|nr:putative adipose-regulatory protein-domain-containing protein [Aspergillus pseudonomiae]KAB8257809.1 putative adipose-regulatory protein-domain-containing protein [Aspergillus pseudonomiae]KAE8398894.1 putative adipose-regulatory protein-domain-containing protein [Aspergillus pseudonomiae]
MESDYSSEEDADHKPTALTRTTNALVRYTRPFFSKQAQKAYLGTLLFIGTGLCMLFGSALAYGVFYYRFVPQVGVGRVVHLQFGDGHPWGIASLGSELVSLQAYDVNVELELPRTPSNLAAGNFMLDLTLVSQPSTSVLTGTNSSTFPLSRSRRPAILTYASPLVDTASKLSLMPFYVFGWTREAEKLVVPMMERVEFARGRRNLPESLRLEIHSNEEMQIYKATVEFKARFTGLRWMMYNWKITSFFIFSSLFWSICMTSASISWVIIASLSSTGTHEPEMKEEAGDETPIKQEPSEETSSLMEAPSTSSANPEERRRIKREDEYEADDDESDGSPRDRGTISSEEVGAGTGLESAEARGVQRRRSRLFNHEHS